MVRRYDARTALEGAIFDATAAIHNNEVHRAYIILCRKIVEIDKTENSTWGKVDWK